MSLFPKKHHFSFAEIIKGIQYGLNSAQDMLQSQQMNNISNLLRGQDGSPVCCKVKVDNRELEVPLLALLPHSHLTMNDVEIKFNAKVGDIVEGTLSGAVGPISHADLQMSLEGVKMTDKDSMQITLRFRQQHPTEALSRILDEYNKLI